MKLIKPKFEILEQQPGIDGIYKQIELAGRTCYKSEDKITEDSAKGFVDRMIKSGHGAMLEHGTVYLSAKFEETNCIEEEETIYYNPLEKYYDNVYSHVREEHNTTGWFIYVTTNLRVLVENDWMDDLQYICEPTEYHEKRVCVRFTCDRGVSHEFVRHRVFSFAQESTRYCNYSKDKFGNELTFILPCWMSNYDLEDYKRRIERGDFRSNEDGTEGSFSFIFGLEEMEDIYISLVNEKNWKPQQARAILPNALKTELVMTGFVSDWWGTTDIMKDNKLVRSISNSSSNLEDEIGKYDSSYKIVRNGFFGLRCAPSAHPQAQELAIPLKREFIKRGLLVSK